MLEVNIAFGRENGAGCGVRPWESDRLGFPFRLLLVAQPLISYCRILFNPRMHIPYDIAAFHLPKRAPYARMLFILMVITVVWVLGDQTPIYRLLYTHLPRLLRGCLYAGYALLAFSPFVALAAAAALERARAWAPAWLLRAGALASYRG